MRCDICHDTELGPLTSARVPGWTFIEDRSGPVVLILDICPRCSGTHPTAEDA